MHAVECVGLIPSAGKALRISPLPCSKEIYPIGFGNTGKQGKHHPKVAAHYLLEKMHIAGANKTYMVLSKGKWDIPAYLGDGAMANMAIAYLVTDLPYGVPFTLDSAFPFIAGATVVFGFPDIIFEPNDAFVRLLAKQDECNADIVLGLFKAENPQKMDMVSMNNSGAVRKIHIKPLQSNLKYTWIIAVWNYSFTNFLHDFVYHQKKKLVETPDKKKEGLPELHVGDVVQAAINANLNVEKVIFDEGTYVDIGTADDMIRATRDHMPLTL